jgi:hypothetical protein
VNRWTNRVLMLRSIFVLIMSDICLAFPSLHLEVRDFHIDRMPTICHSVKGQVCLRVALSAIPI